MLMLLLPPGPNSSFSFAYRWCSKAGVTFSSMLFRRRIKSMMIAPRIIKKNQTSLRVLGEGFLRWIVIIHRIETLHSSWKGGVASCPEEAGPLVWGLRKKAKSLLNIKSAFSRCGFSKTISKYKVGFFPNFLKFYASC
jgi:hypothetical protein